MFTATRTQYDAVAPTEAEGAMSSVVRIAQHQSDIIKDLSSRIGSQHSSYAPQVTSADRAGRLPPAADDAMSTRLHQALAELEVSSDRAGSLFIRKLCIYDILNVISIWFGVTSTSTAFLVTNLHVSDCR